MVTQAELKKILSYDPATGVFTWKVSPVNSVKVGDVAGSPNNKGYIHISISGKLYKAHRLAFLYMEGAIPPKVDHADRNTLNNAWLNLRPCTQSQNVMNSSTKRGESGLRGVRWCPRNRKWQARIGVNGQRIHLGYFRDKADAYKSYETASAEHHGCFGVAYALEM